MFRKLIAIDAAYATMMAREAGFDVFPVEEFRELVIVGKHSTSNRSNGINSPTDGVDIIETLITLVKHVPDNDSIEEIARIAERVERIQYALEMKGCKVIVCPAKRMPQGGFKQSDDSRLVIATLSTSLKLRPDFLVFVAADGDYAPLLWELRNEGIRTEVVATTTTLASDLRRVAHNIVDLRGVFEAIKQQRR